MYQVLVNAGAETTTSLILPDASVLSTDQTVRIHGEQSLDIGESSVYGAYLIEAAGDSVPASQAEWFTSNTAVVSITGAGEAVTVTGNASGLALLLASVGDATDSLLVLVGGTNATVGSVDLTPATQNVNVGDSTYVQASVRGENGLIIPGYGVTWSVSNSSIVSIMEGFSGDFAILWGLAPGTATVTATADGKSANSTVVVN